MFIHIYKAIYKYLYMWALRCLVSVGETHVTAKPETVGLVVDVNL